MPRVKRSPSVPVSVYVIYNVDSKGKIVDHSAAVFTSPSEIDEIYEDEVVVHYVIDKAGKPRYGKKGE